MIKTHTRFVLFITISLTLFLPVYVLSWTQSTEMVLMRDSVHLATEVYLPDSYTEPLPVILQRTPYNRDMDDEIVDLATDLLGYALVSQNLRGRYESEGVPLTFLSDGWGPLQDGYDCLEWLVAQPWCNGKIGMWGASAPGMTQYYCAGTHHPNLTCIAPVGAGHSLYHYVAYNGGVYRKALVESWLEGIGSLGMVDTIVNHPNYDAFWSVANLGERWDSAAVPAFHATGWYDLYTDGQLEAFSEMKARFGNQKMFIGPWRHGNAWGSRYQGDLVYPPNAEMSEETLALMAVAWYNYWLKDESSEIVESPPITFYLTGDCDEDSAFYWNTWMAAYDWPLPNMEYRSYYLDDGGILDTMFPVTATADTYAYDPENPCPTIGGREYIGLTMGYGPKDQHPIENRTDLLLFSTRVLDEPTIVIGKLKLILYASSNRLDTDWAIRVTDVYPDGRSILMTDNILMARHRNSLASEELLTPEVPDTFEIDIWSIAHVFNAGHRIRIIVSSSNYPRFEKNPNTGAPFIRDDPTTLVATNVVYHSPGLPSHLLLPVVPSEALYVKETTAKPNDFELHCYPNPFNSSVNITCPVGTEIEIYDLRGRLVGKDITTSTQIIWQPDPLTSSGIYLIRAQSGGKTARKRVVYLK
ncbi:CocE/NonD family hydrolase [bacterium]|nr:CocE/NonD family hydrolase [bacterium]